MSKVVKLPSGATASLRDANTLKVKDRNAVFEAAGDKDGVAQNIALGNSLLAVLIEEWSYDLLPPSVKIESLGELPIADYDALVEETLEAQKIMFPDFAKSLQAEADPKADTANSNA